MRTKNRGFTLIEVMIVVAIIAILSTIAIAQFQKYIDRTHDAAVQSLLHNLALAQLTVKIDDDVGGGFVEIDGGASSVANLQKLAEFGFRPDPYVGFAALPFDAEEEGAYVLFAAFSKTGKKIYVYNFAPRSGVRAFDSSAAYMAIIPTNLTVYQWFGDSSTPKATATLALDTANGLVLSVTKLP